ncbi:MAG: hypothetical protein QNJ81_15610 [Acidimicrobiia bacterium]|nr:hypothetical protein [Acidimicrobiia bacterium]
MASADEFQLKRVEKREVSLSNWESGGNCSAKPRESSPERVENKKCSASRLPFFVSTANSQASLETLLKQKNQGFCLGFLFIRTRGVELPPSSVSPAQTF